MGAKHVRSFVERKSLGRLHAGGEQNLLDSTVCRPSLPLVPAYRTRSLLPPDTNGWQYEFYTLRVSRGEVSGGLASPNEPEVSYFIDQPVPATAPAAICCKRRFHRGKELYPPAKIGD